MAYIIYDIKSDILFPVSVCCMVQFINDAIRKAQPGTKLHGLAALAPITDQNDEIMEVLSGCTALGYAAASIRSHLTLTAVGLEKFHALSVELLEVLKEKHVLQNQRARGLEFRIGAQHSSQGA